MPTLSQCGQRKSETTRYRRGSGFSSGEGASAIGTGLPQDEQSTTKYHFPGSVNFGMIGLDLPAVGIVIAPQQGPQSPTTHSVTARHDQLSRYHESARLPALALGQSTPTGGVNSYSERARVIIPQVPQQERCPLSAMSCWARLPYWWPSSHRGTRLRCQRQSQRRPK
jgi:hypothetical protein